MHQHLRSGLQTLLWGCLSVALIGLVIARNVPESVAKARTKLGLSFRVSLPAGIQAAHSYDVIAESGGRVLQILKQEGADLAPGDPLISLENAELSAEVDMARLRATAASKHPSVALHAAERESARAARQDWEAARERVQTFTLRESEDLRNAARQRYQKVQSMSSRGLATGIELEQASQALAAAEREFAARREHGSRLKQELSQAESRLKMAELQEPARQATQASAAAVHEEAQSGAKLAEERLRRLSILAPGAGTLVELSIRSGEHINAGQRLARIADLRELELTAYLDAEAIRPLRIGQPVVVRLPLDPPREIPTVLQTVSRVPDPEHRAYWIRAIVPNPDPAAVLVGLTGSIEIDPAQQSKPQPRH